ncbi:MAG: hypothetical protein WCD35_06740 [Mycobacteriales bacterium]
MNATLQEVLGHATGRTTRHDPTLPRTGGPAGNAQLTARMGLLLLGLFLAELLTLVSVRQLVSWHIAIGVLLIPPALAKTASTGWRMVRYYAGSDHYRQAGPPPLPLRLLGPLVVLSTLAVLATGTTLAVIGQDATFRPLVTVAGHSVTWLTVHQASFAVWATATGLHVLARLIPSLHLTRSSREAAQPGSFLRAVALVTTVAVAAVLAWGVLGLSGSWTSTRFGPESGRSHEGLARP